MSRVGKYPVPVPAGVTAEIRGSVITVKGPKGELTRTLHPDMMIEIGEGTVTVKRPSESKMHKSLHGLTRTLIANMVTGVSQGYEKKLEIEGVEYRAELKGGALMLSLGFAYPKRYEPREGITITVTDPKKISIAGIDKEKVGQTAAEIRSMRPPEPYKGKGIRYAGEQIKRKAGKAAVGTSF
ncbi:MAG: 50S ribosomal protein L6 [Candidatus Latescibacterota bacterium]|jgi:large subunit ribosomal protein L6|nr:MAG: 50S ribosomal protein L6 [Candidatus Latescibacterota bacterium]